MTNPSYDFDKVDYACEADDYVRRLLWEEIHRMVKWEQLSLGRMYTIGFIAKYPVTIQLTWAIIDGHKVLFYWSSSRVVDHEMVDNWVKEHALTTGGIKTDPQNFHLILERIAKQKTPSNP